jgi:5-formyltetrahydrofolate cyclo-ligase
MIISKQDLRQKLRAARGSISNIEREQAANSICDQILQLPYYATAKNVALYWPHDDELNALPLLNRALAEHKHCYLPVLLLDPHQKLAFASYTHETPLIKNRYGIPEPELNFSTLISVTDLDIIFVPVVGFDSHGRRLGRGGGFYDATFADFHKSPRLHWPKLVGLAYSCQQAHEVPADIWDWQLDAIVTEHEVFQFK